MSDFLRGPAPRQSLIIIPPGCQTPAAADPLPATTSRAPWFERCADLVVEHSGCENAAFSVVQLQDPNSKEAKAASLAVRFLMPGDGDHCYAIAISIPRESGGLTAAFIELAFRVAKFAKATWDMPPVLRLAEAEKFEVQCLPVDLDFQS